MTDTSPAATIHAVGFIENLPATDPRSLVDVEVATPTAGPRDLLVEIRAVSVNPADVKVRASAQTNGAVRVLGYDGAGVVVAVGSQVSLFAPGDPVYYAGAFDRPGTNAALHAVDERLVGRKPGSLSFTAAAALPLTTITAGEALFDKLGLTSQSTGDLLVLGASGGVGSMVVQLARALAPGVRIIGSASTPPADQWVRDLGAHETINHRGDIKAQIDRLAPAGVHYIFTPASSDQLSVYASILRPFGQIVGIGDPAVLDVTVLKDKSLSWHWEFMFARSLHQAEDMIRQHELLEQVADLIDAGQVRSTVTTVLSPIDAEHLRQAHHLVETGVDMGKVVVTNDGP